MKKLILVLATVVLANSLAWAQSREATVRVNFGERLGPLEIERMSLGQGGISAEPMWADRISEVRALRPRLIRLFIQEYFDLLPASGRYHFETLDRCVDTILRAGAKPLMNISFKPRLLFPTIDPSQAEPNDYKAWESLVENLVKHYRDRGDGIQFWEVANEPDIGEADGHLHADNLLLWNFSPAPVEVEVSLENMAKDMEMHPLTLDAQAPSNDECVRLRIEPMMRLKKGNYRFKIHFDPYTIKFWWFD